MEEPTPSVFAQVRQVFCSQAPDDEPSITPDTHFRDDSPYTDDIDHLEFLMDIEAHFGLRIPDEIMDEMSTIGDVVRFVEQWIQPIDDGWRTHLATGFVLGLITGIVVGVIL